MYQQELEFLLPTLKDISKDVETHHRTGRDNFVNPEILETKLVEHFDTTGEDDDMSNRELALKLMDRLRLHLQSNYAIAELSYSDDLHQISDIFLNEDQATILTWPQLYDLLEKEHNSDEG